MNKESAKAPLQLERKLGPVMLWGLGVGYVISGMYFGWNLGLPTGGTLGLAVATGVIILMYLAFTFSYTELACAIPKAGGAFDYAQRGFGSDWGFIAGMAQAVEFVFAPPAIAAAIGAYFHIFLPGVPTMTIAVVAYILFTALNISGVKAAAQFELLVTVLAVAELLIFAGVTLPSVELKNLTANPRRNILIGFGAAIFTLVALAVLTFVGSVGVGGWESVVYPETGAAPSDSPLPLALRGIVGDSHFLYHMLVFIGLFGLVASFRGIILAAGRAVLEMGRAKYLPEGLGKVHPKFKTPANALVIAVVALGAVTYYNPALALIYLAILAGGYAYYKLYAEKRAAKAIGLLVPEAVPVETKEGR